MNSNINYMVTVYGNGSSENHGCEAIIRGLTSLLPDSFYLNILSENPEADIIYGLNSEHKIKAIDKAKTQHKKDFSFINAWLKLKISKNYFYLDLLQYETAILNSSKRSKIAFSVGGDNYCYQGNQIYSLLNSKFHHKKMKTVLFGCSVEPDLLKLDTLKTDFSRYDIILARESISFKALKSVNENTLLAPDPAFFMKPEYSGELEEIISRGNLIGINISPLIIQSACNGELFISNIRKLINYIINETDYNIVFIPHVVLQGNDDRIAIRSVMDEYQDNNRIFTVPDMKAQNLKYLISKCELFIGARTHATIAAYSSFIPTLTIGYSVKSKGIATDLFGTDKNYVLSAQEIIAEYDLLNAFRWLDENKIQIHEHLQSFIPEYLIAGRKAYDLFFKQLNELDVDF